jgi:ABC-type multidrug transport system ATPase subunit
MGLTIARRGEIESSDTAEVGAATSPVLEVDGLTVSVQTASGSIDVIEDVSFSVGQGEILGLVGESGSGKTVTSLSITRLLSSPPFSITGGRVIFGGQDLLSVPMSTMRAIRGQDIGMIFQDPMAALNPSVSIGRQIGEAVRLHEGASRRVAERRALELLDRVGIRTQLKIYSVDIVNPMNIAVYYQDFNTVVLLDNKLSEIERINFNNLSEFINSSQAMIAANNSLWFINMDSQQLELYNYRLKSKILVSQPINGEVLSIASNFNYCYVLNHKTKLF